MNNKKIFKNYIYNLLYQILVLITPLITIPYISRVLGVNQIGKYSYTQSIVAYFSLFATLGIAMYGQREIAYNQDDEKSISRIFIEIFLLRFLTVSISLAIFSLMFLRSGEYRILFAIQILDIISTLFDISWFFQGLEEFKKTVVRNIFIKSGAIIFIFLFVRNENDINIYVLCNCLALLLGNLSLWLYIPKYVKFKDIGTINVFRHLKITLQLFIPQAATQIYTILDKTMLGYLSNNMVEVGFYEQSQKIVKMLLMIVTALGIVMLPRISNAFSKNDKEQIEYYIQKSFRIVLLISFPMTLGICSIIKDFVPIFFGIGYEKVSILILTISPILIISGINNIIGIQYLLPTNRQNQYSIAVVVGAASNFIVNLFVLAKFQAIGACVATVIAEFIILIVQILFVKKDLNLKNYIKIIPKYLIASVIMFIFINFIPIFLKGKVLQIFIKVIIGGFIYLLTLSIMKEEFSELIINKIINSLKKR